MVTWITSNWAVLVQIITGMVTVASLIVKLTPTTEDDTILAKIISILKVLALNK